MRFSVLIVMLLACLVCTCMSTPVTDRVRVAIIGSGITGSAAAHYIHQLESSLGVGIDITVLERSGVIGGRLRNLVVDDIVTELGGAIAMKTNQYFYNATASLGLHYADPPHAGRTMGVFNGPSHSSTASIWSFLEHDWKIVNMIKMFARYGTSLMTMQNLVAEFGERFYQIYRLQAQGEAFKTPDQLLRAIGLYEHTQQTLRELLAKYKLDDGLVNELVSGLTRINYGQDVTLNGLAGVVALFPTTQGSAGLFSVKGGNKNMVDALLYDSGATIHFNTIVKQIVRSVTRTGRPIYTVHVQDGTYSQYDIVVVATPLEFSKIQITGIDDTIIIPPREFQTIHTSIIHGRINPAFFGFAASSPDDTLPGTILTPESSALPFNSMGTFKKYDNGERLVKLFSRAPLSASFLASYFAYINTSDTTTQWLAYPRFAPPEKFAPFELAGGLYYANALENGLSVIECGFVTAKNVQLLIGQYLRDTILPFKAVNTDAPDDATPDVVDAEPAIEAVTAILTDKNEL